MNCRFLRHTAVALAIVPLIASVANADPAPPGKIIVTKLTGAAIVLYNASSEVTDYGAGKMSDAQTNDRIERDALQALALKAALFKDASTITVRVLYDKTGAVSPTYGTISFQGIERYATLTMSAADATHNRDGWQTIAFGSGSVPAWIAFDIKGQLPPR